MKLLKVTIVKDAFRIIFDSFCPLEKETVPLHQAGGRYTADEILAREDVPAFDRSIVDGFAVQASETFGA